MVRLSNVSRPLVLSSIVRIYISYVFCLMRKKTYFDSTIYLAPSAPYLPELELSVRMLLLLFFIFSVLVANPKKTLYAVVANPARGLLNREKK